MWLIADPDFGKVLTIRQALGRAQLSEVEKLQTAMKNLLVEQLDDLLKPLLPRSSDPNLRPYDIHVVIAKLTDMAVQLANMMTQERAIFRSYFLKAGHQPTEVEASVPNTEQTGNVFMCTFPGFYKKVRDGKQTIQIVMVKANVELQSRLREEAVRKGDGPPTDHIRQTDG